MDPELAERLARIESHLAHVERQFEELNAVAVEQGALLRKLQTRLQRVAETIERNESDRIKETNPKPPHYQ